MSTNSMVLDPTSQLASQTEVGTPCHPTQWYWVWHLSWPVRLRWGYHVIQLNGIGSDISAGQSDWGGNTMSPNSMLLGLTHHLASQTEVGTPCHPTQGYWVWHLSWPVRLRWGDCIIQLKGIGSDTSAGQSDSGVDTVPSKLASQIDAERCHSHWPVQ